jgi:ribonuclease VapC
LILDSSAVIAILRKEPGYEDLVALTPTDPGPGIGAPTLSEAGIVLVSRLGERGRSLLGRFITETDTDVIPFGEDHWQLAVEAHHRYGKGRHRAGLNFGDCLTYAVAKLAGEPLLAVGDDFAHTDLELA